MKKLIMILGCIFIPFARCSTTLAQGFGDTEYVDGINIIGTKEPTIDASLLDTIKNTINRILGILATVALVICMYAGFKMLTSGGDDKGYKSGLSTLKNAALGLAIIGLSWLIVSAIFWFVELMGGN